jgi:hypothetical protein
MYEIQVAHDGADEVEEFKVKVKLFGKSREFKSWICRASL